MPKASDHAFSENYKRKSNGVDKRVLRAYRKSVDRKELREQELYKRRHLDILYETTIGGITSPLAIRSTTTKSEDSKESDGSRGRRDMLMRWKQEKEMKKKIESMEHAKKKPFRVLHVEQELIPFKKTEAVKKPALKRMKTDVRNVPLPAHTVVEKHTAKSSNTVVPRVTRNTSKPPVVTAPESRVSSHVNTKRGQTSFAPSGFQFCAPSHLAFEFRPLSPNSAAVFLRPSSANSSSVEQRMSVSSQMTGVNSVLTKARSTRHTEKTSTVSATPSMQSKSVDKAKQIRSTTRQAGKVAVASNKGNVQEAVYQLRSGRTSSKTADPVNQTAMNANPVRPTRTAAVKRQSAKQMTSVDKVLTKPMAKVEIHAQKLVEVLADIDEMQPIVHHPSKEDAANKNKLAGSLKSPHARKSSSEDSMSPELPSHTRASVSSLILEPCTVRSVELDTKLSPLVVIGSKSARKSVAKSIDVEADDVNTMSAAVRRKSRRSLAVDSAITEDATQMEGEASRKSRLSGYMKTSRGNCESKMDNESTTEYADSVLVSQDNETVEMNMEISDDQAMTGETSCPRTLYKDSDTVNAVSRDEPELLANIEQKPLPEAYLTIDKRMSELSTALESPFQTPGVMRRGRSIAQDLTSGSCRRKTPKNVRSSLILRRFSPEECIEILKESPMIEMTRRRTIKGSPATSMLNLDDVEDIIHTIDVTGQTAQEVIDSQSSSVMECTPAEQSQSTKVASSTSQVPNAEAAGLVLVDSQSRPAGHEDPDVMFFRDLLKTEAARLTTMCTIWRETLNTHTDISEDIRGNIRTVIGQAELLMSQRFKQFSGLVDNCEFNSGEKEVTCTDLQGFWDMVYFQVEDVDAKFINLGRLKAANWVELQPSPVKKKIVKNREARATAKQKPTVPAVAKKVQPAKSSFADFRRKMQQNQQKEIATESVVELVSGKDEMKTFQGGFYNVTSPVRTPNKSQENGSTRRDRKSGCRGVCESPLLTVTLMKCARRSLSVRGSTAAVFPVQDPHNTAAESPRQAPTRLRSILHHCDVVDITENASCNERKKKTVRKSVFFAEKEEVDTQNDAFSTPVKSSESSSQNYTPVVDKENLQYYSPLSEVSNTKEKTPQLIDVDDEDSEPLGFGGLKVGFTPGVDGKSRRVSGFSPMACLTSAVPALGSLDENIEDSFNLMHFSPAASKESKTRRSSVRRSVQQPARRRSSRLSMK